MNEQEYQKLKTQVRVTREKNLAANTEERERIVLEHTQQVEAIELVYSISRKSQPTKTRAARIEGLFEKVKSVVGAQVGAFTQPDITHILEPQIPSISPASVSSALRRLEALHTISLVEKGSGRNPSVFKRVKK